MAEEQSAAHRFMEHLALWEGAGDGIEETAWLEKVPEATYNGPRTSGR